ncbi:MAG TPA: GntR family transcriptional regulator [Edaphobacter sp.]
MIFRVNPSSGIPLYLQLMEQVKHAVETGALREGDQLPTIRRVAEELVMNPNTVVRAYRELEHEGVLELRHGAGAFIKASGETRARLIRRAQTAMEGVIERLMEQGLTEDELRRAFESELAKAEERRGVASTTGTATTGRKR